MYTPIITPIQSIPVGVEMEKPEYLMIPFLCNPLAAIAQHSSSSNFLTIELG